MFNKKGNMAYLILIIIIIFYILILCSSLLEYITIGLKENKSSNNSITEIIGIDNIKTDAITNLLSNNILQQETYQKDDYSVTITPIQIQQAVPYEYKTDSQGNLVPVYLKQINQYQYIRDNTGFNVLNYEYSIDINDCSNYFIIANTDFSLYDINHNLVGNSIDSQFFYNINDLNSNGLGTYTLDTQASQIYILKLPEWNRYYFNAIYKITIANSQTGQNLVVFTQKYDTNLVELYSSL